MATIYKKNGEYIVNNPELRKVDLAALDYGEVLEVTVKAVDRRYITHQQRKFIFALLGEIEYETGIHKEVARQYLQQLHSIMYNEEVQSLSNCSMTYANELIDTIIMYCIEREIPIGIDLLKDNDFTFNEKQTYMMTLKRVCVVCGRRADIHHVDAVGRRNRDKISHLGMRVIPVCRAHHNEAHNIGNTEFLEKYHLTTARVDEKLEHFIKKGYIPVHETDENIEKG